MVRTGLQKVRRACDIQDKKEQKRTLKSSQNKFNFSEWRMSKITKIKHISTITEQEKS